MGYQLFVIHTVTFLKSGEVKRDHYRIIDDNIVHTAVMSLSWTKFQCFKRSLSLLYFLANFFNDQLLLSRKWILYEYLNTSGWLFYFFLTVKVDITILYPPKTILMIDFQATQKVNGTLLSLNLENWFKEISNLYLDGKHVPVLHERNAWNWIKMLHGFLSGSVCRQFFNGFIFLNEFFDWCVF